MNDEQKQIKEIAKILCGKSNNECCTVDGWMCTHKNYAEKLYNEGCRIFSKNAVVLTREEYEQLKYGKPLTVEQLKEMPVGTWVCIDDFKATLYGHSTMNWWKKTMPLPSFPDLFQCGTRGYGTDFDFKEYGETWIAFDNGKAKARKETAEKFAERYRKTFGFTIEESRKEIAKILTEGKK